MIQPDELHDFSGGGEKPPTSISIYISMLYLCYWYYNHYYWYYNHYHYIIPLSLSQETIIIHTWEIEKDGSHPLVIQGGSAITTSIFRRLTFYCHV